MVNQEKYLIKSPFLQHCLIYNIVQLSDLEAEILEKAGYDTHFVCKSLAEENGITVLKEEIKEIYVDLHYKDEAVQKDDFQLTFLNVKRFKAIGMYASMNDREYFLQMDECGMIVEAKKKQKRNNNQQQNQQQQIQQQQPEQQNENQPQSPPSPQQQSSVSSNSTSISIEDWTPIDLDGARLSLLNLARQTFIKNKLMSGEQAIQVEVDVTNSKICGKVHCPLENCSTTIQPSNKISKNKVYWVSSAITRHIESHLKKI